VQPSRPSECEPRSGALDCSSRWSYAGWETAWHPGKETPVSWVDRGSAARARWLGTPGAELGARQAAPWRTSYDLGQLVVSVLAGRAAVAGPQDEARRGRRQRRGPAAARSAALEDVKKVLTTDGGRGTELEPRAET
jgi:hypothetical protein